MVQLISSKSAAFAIVAFATTTSGFVTPSNNNQNTSPAFVPKLQSSTALKAAPTMVIY